MAARGTLRYLPGYPQRARQPYRTLVTVASSSKAQEAPRPDRAGASSLVQRRRQLKPQDGALAAPNLAGRVAYRGSTTAGRV